MLPAARRLAAAAALVVAAHPAHALQTIDDDYNVGAAHNCCAYGPYALGYSFTASRDFLLGGIYTEFGDPGPNGSTYGGRTITVQLMTGPNGSVLRSASFASSPLPGLVGGTFADFAMTAGTTYLVAWMNVGLLPDGGLLLPNTTLSSGTTTGVYGAFSQPLHLVSSPGNPWSTSAGVWQPIVRLQGSTVPEPATTGLVGLGLAAIGAGARRRAVVRASPHR